MKMTHGAEYPCLDSSTKWGSINPKLQVYDAVKFELVYQGPSGLAFFFAYTLAMIRTPVDLAALCEAAILPLMAVLFISALFTRSRRRESRFHRIAFTGALTIGLLWVPGLILAFVSRY